MVAVTKLIGFLTIIANVFAAPPPLDLFAPALASSRCNKAEVLKTILSLLITTLNNDGVGTPKLVTDTANIKDVVAEIKNLLNPQQIPPDLHKELSNKLEGLEKALGPEKSELLTLPFHLPITKKPACVKALEQLLDSSKEAYAKILDGGCEEEGPDPYMLVNNEKGYRNYESLEPLNNFKPNPLLYRLKNSNQFQKFIPATESHRYPFYLKKPHSPPPRKIKLIPEIPFNENAPFSQSLLEKLKEATRLASLKSSYGLHPSSIFPNNDNIEVVNSPTLLQKYKTSHDNNKHPWQLDKDSPDESELKYSKLGELLPQLLKHYDNENPTQYPEYREVKYSVHVPEVDYGRYEPTANEYPYKYSPYLPGTGNSDEYERPKYVTPDEYQSKELESVIHNSQHKKPPLLQPVNQEYHLPFTKPYGYPGNQYKSVKKPKSFNPDDDDYDDDDVLKKNILAKLPYNLYNPDLRPGEVPQYMNNYVHSDIDLNPGNDIQLLPQIANSAELPFAYNHEAGNVQNNYPPFDKDEILEIRPVGTNQHDLITTPNHKGVIELTYLLKKPTPIVYHPYYYVKYRIPFKDFSVQLQRLLRSRPELRSHPEELYKDLLALSVKELPAELQESAKKEIHDIVYNDGTLVKAKVLKGKAAIDTVYPVVRSNDLTKENNDLGYSGTETLDAEPKDANNDATSESPKVYIHPKPITTRVYTLKEFEDMTVRSKNAVTNNVASAKPLRNLPSLEDAISKFGYQPFRKLNLLNNDTKVTPQEYLDRILDNNGQDKASDLETKSRKRRFVGLSPFGVNPLVNPLVNNVQRSVIPALLASQQANRLLPGRFGPGRLGTRLAFGRRKKRFSGLAPFGLNPLLNPLVNTVQSSVIPAVLASQQAAGVLPGGLRNLGTTLPFGRRKKRFSGLSDKDKASDLEPKIRKRRFVGLPPFGVNPLVNPLANNVHRSVIPAVLASQQANRLLPGGFGLGSLGTRLAFGRRKKRFSGLSPFGYNPLVNPLVNTVQSSVIPAVLASQQAAGVLPGNYGHGNLGTGFSIPGTFPGQGLSGILGTGNTFGMPGAFPSQGLTGNLGTGVSFGIPGAFPGYGVGVGVGGGNPLGYLG